MKRVLIPLIVPALGAITLVGWALASRPAPADAAPPRGQQCFRGADVNGFTPRGETSVDVNAGASRVYRLTLATACPDVDWSFSLGIRTTSGSSWICEGFDAEIFTPGPGGVQRCAVSDVRRLSPEEIQAARHQHGH